MIISHSKKFLKGPILIAFTVTVKINAMYMLYSVYVMGMIVSVKIKKFEDWPFTKIGPHKNFPPYDNIIDCCFRVFG